MVQIKITASIKKLGETSVEVLTEAAEAVGLKSITVTSTQRPSRAQAEAMLTNIENNRNIRYKWAGQQVIDLAKQYIGVRYVYGGTTPNGFDCSGFVQYVYRQMGVKLNRVAEDQAKNGVYVAKEDLKPGDMVFFKKPGRAIHHVGLYVGNGMYIHAPYTGRTICIEPMTRYYTARRVLY